MGRSPCCSKVGLNKGAWTAAEDRILTEYINLHGEGRWRNLPNGAGLQRCGKSCRLRWLNYLRPGIKRGNISHDEEELIIRLHKLLGNRWSLIAGRLPERTDNEIKNYWNTVLSKRIHDHHPRPRQSRNSSTQRNSKKSSEKKKEKNIEPCIAQIEGAKGPRVIKLFRPRPMKIVLHEANEDPEQSSAGKKGCLITSPIDESRLEHEEVLNNPWSSVMETEAGKICVSADDQPDKDFSALFELKICNSNDNVDYDMSSVWDGSIEFCEEFKQEVWTATDYAQPNVALDGPVFPSLL